jgi:hypothetical protein
MALSLVLEDESKDLRSGDPAMSLHLRLARLGERRLRPMFDEQLTPSDLRDEMEDRWEEERFLTIERASAASGLGDVPTESDAFIRWFENLSETGPGQGDPLFPWLANQASFAELRWFLKQEAAGEAGFDDLVALTQLQMPSRVKLEMARNFWDEMGRGHANGMHGPLLSRLTDDVDAAAAGGAVLWEPLALTNLMVALATNRRYAFQSVGALGAIELTAPARSAAVNDGLRRHGVSPGARKYFAVHAHLDVQHSRSWNDEVIRPLVSADGRIARALAEGALLRLHAGARCFARYRRHFGFTGPNADTPPGGVVAASSAASRTNGVRLSA